ncbi:unnamed protein product [Bathycoccus prasinos]
MPNPCTRQFSVLLLNTKKRNRANSPTVLELEEAAEEREEKAGEEKELSTNIFVCADVAADPVHKEMSWLNAEATKNI